MDPSLMVQQGPNPGERFAQAFKDGQATAKQNKARAALAALMRDPSNANAFAALAETDPETAMKFRQQRIEEAKAHLGDHYDSVLKGAQLIRQMQPKDDASWQQLLSVAHQAGIDVSQVPPHFDQQYVSNIVQLADAFKPQNENGSQVVVTPQPGTPAYIYDKGTGSTKQIVFPEGQAPPPLTDDQIRSMRGGQAGGGSPGGF